jgi:hypothetical protein
MRRIGAQPDRPASLLATSKSKRRAKPPALTIR